MCIKASNISKKCILLILFLCFFLIIVNQKELEIMTSKLGFVNILLEKNVFLIFIFFMYFHFNIKIA